MIRINPLLFPIVLCLAHAAFATAPNFLLILTDDQGWSQLSETIDSRVAEAQSSYLETPNMNRLGRSGIRFTSGYSPAPLCTPTRRAILCGTTAARSGSEFKSAWIPADHTTIPVALKQANPDYRCAHFGKWGENMISTPEQCGYDASDGMTGNLTGGMPRSLNPGNPKATHTNTPPFYIDNEDPKLTKTVTNHAIAFMREQATSGKPFYVQASYYAQHLSVVCSEPMLEKYKKKGAPDRGYTEAWAGMMEELDNGVGDLLDALDSLDIVDNTYVVFMADNGGRGTVPGGDNTRTPTNIPLTGAKHSLYEGGIRVPFMVRGPGIKAGTVSRTPVAGYDLLPTFYELAGGKFDFSKEVDGVSLRPIFADSAATLKRRHDALIFHRPNRGFSAIRQDDYKLMLLWTKQGKIRGHELYKLSDDPREEGNDIADAQPEKATALKSSLLSYLESVSAETPLSNNRRTQNQ